MKIIENLKGLGQDIKNAGINPNDIKDPARLSKFCQAVKVISVVATIMAVVSAIFAGPIALAFAALFAVVMYDTFKMASNVQKIADQKQKGLPFQPMDPYSMTNNIARGTIFAKPIIGLVSNKVVKST